MKCFKHRKIQPDPGLSLKSPRTKSGTSALEVGVFSGCEVFKNHAKPCWSTTQKVKLPTRWKGICMAQWNGYGYVIDMFQWLLIVSNIHPADYIEAAAGFLGSGVKSGFFTSPSASKKNQSNLSGAKLGCAKTLQIGALYKRAPSNHPQKPAILPNLGVRLERAVVANLQLACAGFSHPQVSVSIRLCDCKMINWCCGVTTLIPKNHFLITNFRWFFLFLVPLKNHPSATDQVKWLHRPKVKPCGIQAQGVVDLGLQLAVDAMAHESRVSTYIKMPLSPWNYLLD